MSCQFHIFFPHNLICFTQFVFTQNCFKFTSSQIIHQSDRGRYRNSFHILNHINDFLDSHAEMFVAGWLSFWQLPCMVSFTENAFRSLVELQLNCTVLQIPWCTCPISPNAPLCNRNVHLCAHFCYKMAHYGIFVRCIVGFVRWVFCSGGFTKSRFSTHK